MIICWYCQKETNIKDNDYGDHICNHCNVMISNYNPNDIINQEPEEKEHEMIDYSSEKYQGKFVYLPTMGETEIFDIAELDEVKSDNPRFNFNENVPVMLNGEQVIDDEGEPVFKKKDLGYHIEAKLKNGKVLSITSMSAFIQVFKKHNIQDGDKIKVFHKDKGVWEVEKINGNSVPK